MFYRLLVYLRKPSNALWVMPTVGALLAVLIAMAASWVNVFVPPSFLPDVDLDTLESLLDVIASSMLAVSTFSLSIMVSAFASASNSATPRATEVVMGDDNTRMAIASFISAFIYAIIAKIALGLGYYGQNGRFALFIATIFVLIYLIVTLIRWVHTLSQLGRLENTLDKIHKASEAPLYNFRVQPNLGAAWSGQLDQQAYQVKINHSGFLTHIDMAGLQRRAEENNWYVHIAVRPGDLIMPDTVVAYANLQPEHYAQLEQEENQLKVHELAHCFVLDSARTYAQDPGWGVIVLSEAAQRALSAAINDPGTAIRVMSSFLALFVDTQPSQEDIDKAPTHDRLSIQALDCGQWIEEGFMPIVRDGAALLEVNLVLQKVLSGIARNAPEAAMQASAQKVACLALERAEQTLAFDSDIERLRAKHTSLFA